MSGLELQMKLKLKRLKKKHLTLMFLSLVYAALYRKKISFFVLQIFQTI